MGRQLSFDVDSLQDSSKAKRLKEIVEEARTSQSRVIVFSYFKHTINQVCDLIQKNVYGPITGSISPAERQEIIDQFSKSPDGSVLVSQIQAGGTGLNIQAANVVILCEPQFKPSIEQQAIGRAHRMGQKKDSVLVYRLLCSNTIEERMMKTLAEKQDLFDRYADHSSALEQIEQNGTIETDRKDRPEIDNKSFYRLVEEEIDAIRQQRDLSSPSAKTHSEAIQNDQASI